MELRPNIGFNTGSVNIAPSITPAVMHAMAAPTPIAPLVPPPSPVAPVIPQPVSVAPVVPTPVPVTHAVPSLAPVVAPIPSAPVVSAPPALPEATTLSKLIQSVAVSSTPTVTSLLRTTTEAVSSSSTSSYFAEETPILAPEPSSTPSDVPSSAWVVNDEKIGTKIIIYALIGFFLGFFILLIIIDIYRRPQQAKESIMGLGSAIYNFPKSIVRGIYKCLTSRKPPRPKPEVAVHRDIENAAVIDRLAARRPDSANPNEKAASSADASSNTAVEGDQNQDNAPGAASDLVAEQETKPVKEAPEQSQAVGGHSTATIRRVSISEPPEIYRRPGTSKSTLSIAELEAIPVKRRPVSSNYSVVYEEKAGEGFKKPDIEPVLENLDTEPVPEKPETESVSGKTDIEPVTEKPGTDTRSWAEWEAHLMATVRNPHA